MFTWDYIHVLLNPMPVYGLSVGALALLLGLIMRNRKAQVLALWLVFFGAASALPTYLSGQKAYHKVYLIADSDGQSSLDAHLHRAERLIYVFYGLTVVSLAALLAPAKWPKSTLPLTLITLILSLASLAAGGWIAKAGGEVRHSEFRREPAADEASN
jgi:hypothetical protein